MRISTAQVFKQSVDSFQQQQQKLLVLQKQVASGVRLSKPSDDPAASSRILELNQVVASNQQYQENITLAQSHLKLEEGSLKGIEDVVFRLKELSIQANSGINDATSLRAIGVEVGERLNELQALANSHDSNGDYLFAGYQNVTQPFNETQTGSITHTVYNGDQGQRSLQIGKSRRMTVNNSGSEVFLELPSTTAINTLPNPANSSGATIAPAAVFDASAYVPGTYEIRFTGSATYDVFDVGAGVNIVTGAAYADSTNIDFRGIRSSITGTPATGDVFSVSQGQFKDIFTATGFLQDSMQNSVGGTQRTANIAAFQNDLDGFLNRVLDVRTSIGGRMNALDSQFNSNEAHILATKSTISSLQDTDLSAAISQLTLEKTTLDAAQAMFARITSSSLFNFLR